MQKIEEIQEQQPFAHWLNGVEGIGGAWARKLVEAFGTPEEVYRASEKSLLAIAGSSRLSGLLVAQKRDVHKVYEEMDQAGIFFFPYYHPEYPKRLLQIPDSPFGIYVKGRLPRDGAKSIAIVGARNCSAYGRYVADAFARAFAREGVLVVSGMAKGIDGVAQDGALAAGGSTYAVLGCGVDICYPACHGALYEKICESGGILSTYPPKTAPSPRYFPPRNRIISGLSDAVLVVEAKQKSGTLITVDMALEQGREVYAVPGRITDRLSDGCNRLLVQGAGAALSPAQMLKELSETVWRNHQPDGRQSGTADCQNNGRTATAKNMASNGGAATVKSVTSNGGAATAKNMASNGGAATAKSMASNGRTATAKSMTVNGGAATAKNMAANGGAAAGESTADAQMTIGTGIGGISRQERALLSLLDFYPISMEQIYMMAQQEKLLCGIALPQLMELLWQLVVKGFVMDEGGYYGLKKPI